jgi:hypothetical protein
MQCERIRKLISRGHRDELGAERKAPPGMLESVSTDSRHYPQECGARFAEGGGRFTGMPRMTLCLRDLASHGNRASLHIDKYGNASILHRPPMSGPPKQHDSAIHNHIYLDGKHIASNIVKHITRAAKYAGSVGRQDGRGQFMGPGAERFA